MKLKPLFDRVVLKMEKAEETTEGGIILTASSKEKPQVAEVVAVGPGGVIDGNKIEMQLKVGDRVIVAQYAGNTVKVEDEEYLIVKQNEVLAIVE